MALSKGLHGMLKGGGIGLALGIGSGFVITIAHVITFGLLFRLIGMIFGITTNTDEFVNTLVGSVVVFLPIGGALIGFISDYKNATAEEARATAETERQEKKRIADVRLRKESEERNRLAHINNSKDTISRLATESKQLLNNFATPISEAEHHLTQAEHEFDEGAFAPFWDEIEHAVNRLANYHQSIKRLDYIGQKYHEQAALLRGDSIQVPPLQIANGRIVDPRPTAKRLATIVRMAQKDFQFATIYEQRKTNKLLYEGFRSLGDAIYSMGSEITSSLQALSSGFRVSLDDLLDATQAQTKTISMQTDELIKASRSQDEKLDNIQRGRKPT